MIAVFRAAAFCLLFAFFATPAFTQSQSQYGGDTAVRVGTFLIATEKLGDPNFAETVVLIVQHDPAQGTVGIIINRRTDFPLSQIFPEIKAAPADPVFLGGPVARTSGQALLRLPAKTADTTRVSGDVYLTAAKDLIDKSVTARTSPAKFRLYIGYAGWGAGQLDAEVRLGAWLLVPATPALIFDNDPDSLWSRLVHQSQMQVALLRRALPPVTAGGLRDPASAPLYPRARAP